jgi:hypothetical protein
MIRRKAAARRSHRRAAQTTSPSEAVMEKLPRPADDDQDATTSWPRTIRYCLIIIAQRLPALAALVAWLAGRR